MELIDYLRMLRRQWLWVVGSVVVLTALAAAYVSVAPKSYRATSDLYILGTVVQPVANQNDAAQSASKYVLDNIDSFAALVDSPRVTGPVIKDLKLAETPEQLAKQVTATVVPNTVIITVAATDPSPDQAAAIANATADSLANAIKSVAIPGTEAPVQISSVKPATPPTSPDSPNRTLWLALGLLLGLALGLVIATLREQVRRTPKVKAQAVDGHEATAATGDEPASVVLPPSPSIPSIGARPGTSAQVSVPAAARPASGSTGVALSKDVRDSAPGKNARDSAPGKDARDSAPGKDARDSVPAANGRPAGGGNGAAGGSPTDPEAAPRDPAPTRR